MDIHQVREKHTEASIGVNMNQAGRESNETHALREREAQRTVLKPQTLQNASMNELTPMMMMTCLKYVSWY